MRLRRAAIFVAGRRVLPAGVALAMGLSCTGCVMGDVFLGQGSDGGPEATPGDGNAGEGPSGEASVDAGTEDGFVDSTGTPCTADADCSSASFGCAFALVAGCTATGVCERLAPRPGCTAVQSCACDGTTTSDCDLPPGFAHKPAVSAGACGASQPVPPSCQAAAEGTHPCGSAGESCCTAIAVPGGSLDRTYDPPTPDGGPTALPDGGPIGLADPASVSAFRLDKYEVTVGRFRQFVQYLAAGGSLPADGAGKHVHLNGGQGLLVVEATGASNGYEPGWASSADDRVFPFAPRPLSGNALAQRIDTTELACGGLGTWSATAAGRESFPINCVDWYEAYAFCVWDEGFLPSAAEWGFAAAGGDEQREFPWGSAAPGTSSQYAIYGCYYAPGGVCSLSPVGTATLGVGRWGQLDLAGNVSEWTLDVPPMVAAGPYPFFDPCTDCLETGGDLGLTGGGDFVALASGHVGVGVSVTQGNANIGLRCARTP